MRCILIIIFIFSFTNVYSKSKIADIKKAIKEDNDGLLNLESFHHLNAPHAINPVSVSNFSIIGKNSIRFESNHGECGKEPNWNDCTTERERTELYYSEISWKSERWYKFYIFLPKNYNSIAPALVSLIQWKRKKPSKVLIMFRHSHAGLVFNRNADTFPDSNIILKPNKKLLGNWTEIIFNTNWHPDPKKGFAKVWVDGELKVDFKGRMNDDKKGQKLSLRYGLYSSKLDRYRKAFNKSKYPQRIIYFDGVSSNNTCKKLLNETSCKNLNSQNVNIYNIYDYRRLDKEMLDKRVLKITKSSFDKLDGNVESLKVNNNPFSKKEIDMVMNSSGNVESCLKDIMGFRLDEIRNNGILNPKYLKDKRVKYIKDSIKKCSD